MHVNTKQKKTGKQPNYTNTCTKKYALLFLSASQSENTLYAHVVFFPVFAGTNPFDNANISSSFDGCLNRVFFFGGC